MHARHHRWFPFAIVTAIAIAIWALAALHGYAWQMLWLPAVIAGAAWPRHVHGKRKPRRLPCDRNSCA
jgi:hypothetical protein